METLAVRLVHLLAMALLLGGAAAVWAALGQRHAPRLVRRYEVGFWGGAGAIVLTGVGNLGAIAPAVPDPSTTNGAALAFKLTLVAALLVVSFGRTVLVDRTDDPERSDAGLRLLRRSYAVTTALLLVIVALAVVVARG